MGRPRRLRLTRTQRDNRVTLIEVRNLWKIYDLGEVQVEALRGANLDVEVGEYLALITENGNGKRDQVPLNAAPLNTADVVRACHMSRRTLEKRFREKLKRTPGEELRRARFEHVRRLLLDTDKSIATIAYESGFASGA